MPSCSSFLLSPNSQTFQDFDEEKNEERILENRFLKVQVTSATSWTFSRSEGGALTLKVDLLHNVLGLDALLLVEDEDLPLLVLRPAILIHPNLHLCVWTNRARVHIVSL